MRASSLSGVVGFPAFDNLQRCGSPDTFAFIVYHNNPAGQSDIEFKVNFGGNLEFGGFVTAPNNPGNLSTISTANPLAPRFKLANIPADATEII